jgi:hypothetical protein
LEKEKPSLGKYWKTTQNLEKVFVNLENRFQYQKMSSLHLIDSFACFMATQFRQALIVAGTVFLFPESMLAMLFPQILIA